MKYTIKRGDTETIVNTPRFTTVFGVDATSYFSAENRGNSHHDTDDNKGGNDNDNDNGRSATKLLLLDSKTHQPVAKDKYKCTPRPIPACLDLLRKKVEAVVGNDGGGKATYNYVLVNYYASGDDSIAYHSDDERFLGPNPNIASVTLGAKRDFLMKHKPHADGGISGSAAAAREILKLSLASGDMVVMKGETQAHWLHSVPKRKSEGGGGRINITFRKAVVTGGTENYYRYNVGEEATYRWDEARREMRLIA